MIDKQEVLDFIDAYELAEAFNKLQSGGVRSPSFSKLMQEFVTGVSNTDVTFINRLKVFVYSLDDNSNIVASTQIDANIAQVIPSDPKEKLKYFLAQGDIKNVLDAFTEYAVSINDSSLEMDIILQSGRFHAAKRRNVSGETNLRDWEQTEAKILNALRSIYQDLD